jgi:hypothetical protein
MHSEHQHAASRFAVCFLVALSLSGCSPTSTPDQLRSNADCMHTYTFAELDVFGSLCRSHRTTVASIDCGYQRTILDDLAGLPKNSRDQDFDRALNQAQTDGPE